MKHFVIFLILTLEIEMNYSSIDWLPLITGLFFSTLGFLAYLKINSWREKNLSNQDHSLNSILIIKHRLTGVLVFGILPYIVLVSGSGTTDLTNITGEFSNNMWTWFIPVSGLVIFLSYINSGRQDNLDFYPQIRKKEWNSELVFISAITWTAYLLAYEFLFRGLLFFPLLDIFGLWPAIIINTSIYTIVHIPKGKKETIGAIPAGVILCLLVYTTGSFWIAFFIHVTMALSNEWFSLKKHPEMRVVRK